MSTILKALRRVEEAQGRDHPKPALEGDWLGEEAASTGQIAEPNAAPAPPPARRLPVAIAAVAGLALIGSGAWLLADRGDPAAASATSIESARTEVAALAPSPPPAVPGAAVPPDRPFAAPPSASAAGPIEQPATAPPTPLQRRLRDAADARAAASAAELSARAARTAAPPIAPAPSTDRPAVATSTARAPVTPSRQQPPAAETEPVALARVEPSPPRPVVAEAPAPGASASPDLAPAPAPVAASTPEPVVADVAVLAAPPEIYVERTRWHPAPQRRTARVWIAGVLRDVHEKELLGDLLVSEIRPSAVVFVYEGVRLERALGKR